MSSEADEQVSRAEEKSGAGLSEFESHDGLIEFARGYFASDFQNPARAGCPPGGKLRTLVREGEQPDAELSAHLFGCSDCFREFRAAMDAREQPPQPASWWKGLTRGLVPRPAAVLAGALSLLLLALAGLYFWQPRRGTGGDEVAKGVPAGAATTPLAVPTPDQTARPTPRLSPTQPVITERAARSVNPSAAVRPSPTPAPSTVAAGRRSLGKPPALNTISIDLEEYTALRGDDVRQRGYPLKEGFNDNNDLSVAGRVPIVLRRTPTLLKLKLPEGSLAGTYGVSVVDAFDKSLATTRAHSAGGKSLRAILNVRKLMPGEYRLRLARERGAPLYFPLIVKDTSKKFSGAKKP